MMENTFDGAVGVTKIFFVEFFDVLFFNAVVTTSCRSNSF